MIKNVLFDLDGTLLVMKDQKLFIKMYFEALCKRFCKKLELTPEQLTDGVWKGTEAMFYNDGKALNCEVFWKTFSEACGDKVLKYINDFDDFYTNEFNYAKASTSQNPFSKKCVEFLKEKGYRIVLATNPVFPISATSSRILWAGAEKSLFEHITVYDNSSYCKPNPKYYEEILTKLSMKAEECLMVGNDVDEDMCTHEMGMETYLVTDCLENKHNRDYSNFTQGTFEDFYKFAEELPTLI